MPRFRHVMHCKEVKVERTCSENDNVRRYERVVVKPYTICFETSDLVSLLNLDLSSSDQR